VIGSRGAGLRLEEVVVEDVDGDHDDAGHGQGCLPAGNPDQPGKDDD